MVCSPGSGRMAVMARLLAAGSFSQTIAEEVCHQKLAAQYIHRELREADEANLLDEEDMHVFDLKPMTDPLHLVCCNACKKPIRASQYAAHAGLCRSLNSAEEIILELDGGTGHKKPPKERKKLLSAYANVATSVGEQERFESVDANDISASESHLDEVQMTSSFFMETKRNSSCVDAALVMDGSGISPGNTDYSAGAMPPPTKRSKLMAAEALLLSDPLETASDVTKSLSITTQEALTCREFARGSSAGIENICDHVVGYQKPRHVHEYCLLIKDVPVPLATKMFYSQRNHRLRSALCHLHYESSTKGRCVELVNPKVLPGNTVPAQTSSPKNFSHEIDEHQDKKPDQILAQSSEVYPGKSGGCPPAMNLSNQVPMNNVSRSRTAPVGMMRSNFLLKPYSLAGNSGTPPGTLQQPKGSVPVI